MEEQGIPILHVDDNFIVVNKPAGIATVPGGWNNPAPSLLKILEVDFNHLWIVHRLDRVTSGVVIFARNKETHRNLSMLFGSHTVKKTYHAICNGNPKWEDYDARLPLRFDVGHNHRTVVDHRYGKPSETNFRLLERFSGHCLMEALPTTGRTHQVRIHASTLGFPLLGDTLYNAPKSCLIPRPALHAVSLEFDIGNKQLVFTAPYPDDFKKALDKMRAGR